MQEKAFLTFDDIIKFKNSKEFVLLDKYYKSIRTLDLFNYYGQENPHTNFLANLFKNNNPYTASDKPFKLFLALLSVKAEEQGISDYEIFREIYLNDREIDGLDVFSQAPIGGNKRPDITIEFTINNQKYVIVLEAKIGSIENETKPYKDKLLKQTELYRTLTEDNSKYKNCKRYYVYLSTLENPDISDKNNWITITYQNLVDYVLSPCTCETSNSDLPITMDEYIKSYSNSFDKAIIGNLRLALTPKEKELVGKLWDKHANILKLIKDSVINITNPNPINYTDIEKMVDTFYESNKIVLMFIYETLYKMKYIDEENLITLNRQKRLHYFNGESVSNVDLFYKVIKDIIENENIENIEQLNNIVTINNWKCLTDDFSKLNEEELKWKDKYRTHIRNQIPITINDKLCYYWTYFPEAIIQTFIDNVKQVYPKRYNQIIK